MAHTDELLVPDQGPDQDLDQAQTATPKQWATIDHSGKTEAAMAGEAGVTEECLRLVTVALQAAEAGLGEAEVGRWSAVVVMAATIATAIATAVEAVGVKLGRAIWRRMRGLEMTRTIMPMALLSCSRRFEVCSSWRCILHEFIHTTTNHMMVQV